MCLSTPSTKHTPSTSQGGNKADDKEDEDRTERFGRPAESRKQGFYDLYEQPRASNVGNCHAMHNAAT